MSDLTEIVNKLKAGGATKVLLLSRTDPDGRQRQPVTPTDIQQVAAATGTDFLHDPRASRNPRDPSTQQTIADARSRPPRQLTTRSADQPARAVRPEAAMKPTTVMMPTARPPFSNASGIIVLASMVRMVPAANACTTTAGSGLAEPSSA